MLSPEPHHSPYSHPPPPPQAKRPPVSAIWRENVLSCGAGCRSGELPCCPGERGAGGAQARDAAHPAAAPGAGAGQPHVGGGGLHPPTADFGIGLRERPGEVAMEDVTPGHRELLLELDRRSGLEARLAVRVLE